MRLSIVLWISPGSLVKSAPNKMSTSFEFLLSSILVPKLYLSIALAISNEFWSSGSPLGSKRLCCRDRSSRNLSIWYWGRPLTSETRFETPFRIITIPNWEMGFWSKNSTMNSCRSCKVMANLLGLKSFSSIVSDPSIITIKVRMIPLWNGVVGFFMIFFFLFSIIVWMTFSNDWPASSSSLTISQGLLYRSSHEYPPSAAAGPLLPDFLPRERRPPKSSSSVNTSGDESRSTAATYSSSESIFAENDGEKELGWWTVDGDFSCELR